MLSLRYLHISCLEPSDSGEYVCKDMVTSASIDSYRLIVKNQGMLFHIVMLLYMRGPFAL